MTNSENKALKKDEVQDVDTCEDEIDLMDYFSVLWKRKLFIILTSILPAFIVGLVMFLQPRNHTITFTYNQELCERDLRILEDTFYGEDNIKKLVGKLQTGGFEKDAQRLANAGNYEDLKKIVAFEVSPSLVESANIRSFEEIQRIKKEKGNLLLVSLTLSSEKNMGQTALVFRENFEKVIPLYLEREILDQNVMELKDEMAAIERSRHELNMQLERKKSTLEKLSKLSSEGLDKLPSDNVVLQFNDVKDCRVYLPLPYQRQAAETQIINIEEQVRTDKDTYDYYVGLFKLSEKLFSYADKAIASDSTLGQFCLSLTNMLAEYKDNVSVADYLSAYIKRVENRAASNIPITEKPKVYSVAKGTVKKSGIVFVIAFMLSVFTAILREGIEKREVRSKK